MISLAALEVAQFRLTVAAGEATERKLWLIKQPFLSHSRLASDRWGVLEENLCPTKALR